MIRILQPALPAYRVPFFARLAETRPGKVIVYHSPTEVGGLERTVSAEWARSIGPLQSILPGALWQSGAASLPLSRGDVLVLWANPRCISTLVLILRARMLGARVIWWNHYWSSTSRAWRMPLRLLLMRLAHGILFYTDREVAEYCAGPGRRDRRPVSALNNGIDTTEIKALRTPYDAATRGREILFIGRITDKARLTLLIRALAVPELGDCRLHVVGDGDRAAAARQLAAELGVADRIVWHGTTTEEAAISPIASRCRLFVYPGEVGLSLIHGMAYGLPSIVHSDRWKHMPEIAAFEEGRSGKSFMPDDVDDLARTMSELIGDDDALGILSERCIAITDESFNTEDMTRRFFGTVKRVGS